MTANGWFAWGLIMCVLGLLLGVAAGGWLWA